jgi:hypothetical protein
MVAMMPAAAATMMPAAMVAMMPAPATGIDRGRRNGQGRQPQDQGDPHFHRELMPKMHGLSPFKGLRRVNLLMTSNVAKAPGCLSIRHFCYDLRPEVVFDARSSGSFSHAGARTGFA